MIENTEARVIVALDMPTDKEALRLLEKLDPKLCHLKVGLTLFTQYGPGFVEALMKKGFLIFLDLKFHDIPHQVAGACRSAAELGVWMLTVHTLGGEAMCIAAAEALTHYKNPPKLLGVTILTSANQDDLSAIGIEKNLEACVDDLATMAINSGLDGVVCSPIEVANLSHKIPKDFLLVTPGIRFTSEYHDDQKRVMTPEEAFTAGSSYIVMGRPILHASDPHALLVEVACNRPTR